MRPAARMKAGFYAAPQPAIDLLLQRLRPPASGNLAVLDPCAGEGAALLSLTAGLQGDDKNAYAIELDPTRGDAVRALLPRATVLAPCSLFQTSIKYAAFGMIYCNPPFDDSLGGERVELKFLHHVTHLLAPSGVLAFVAPEPTLDVKAFRDALLSGYGHIATFPFPPDCRKYGEMFITGIKRREAVQPQTVRWGDNLAQNAKYTVPDAPGPGDRFRKTGMTHDELVAALEKSPLNRYMKPAEELALPSPPLALGAGHLALLLASGHLDGLVCPPGEMPHVVRGVAKKVEEVTDEEIEKTKGTVTTKTTLTERIKLVVRAIWQDGTMRTLE